MWKVLFKGFLYSKMQKKELNIKLMLHLVKTSKRKLNGHLQSTENWHHFKKKSGKDNLDSLDNLKFQNYTVCWWKWILEKTLETSCVYALNFFYISFDKLTLLWFSFYGQWLSHPYLCLFGKWLTHY